MFHYNMQKITTPNSQISENNFDIYVIVSFFFSRQLSPETAAGKTNETCLVLSTCPRSFVKALPVNITVKNVK